MTLHETAETTAQDTAAAIDAYLDKVRPTSAASLLSPAERGTSSLLRMAMRQPNAITGTRDRTGEGGQSTDCRTGVKKYGELAS